MLGWVHQPAGTQAGSPGRAVGGPGRLGYRVKCQVQQNRRVAGFGKRRGSGGLDKQEQDWVRGVLRVFVGLAWLRARVPGGELFKSVQRAV